MRYDIRPLVAWTDPETPVRRSSSRFKASWADTLEFLSAEISKVGGKEPVVLQVNVTEGDIRLDGMLRANAKVGHPGVVVSFDSDFGPLRYATDAYEKDWSHGMPSWQANIRAIALTLEALRAIDRWGVSKRGEQYTGWKALPSGGSVTFPSADRAARGGCGTRLRTSSPCARTTLRRHRHVSSTGCSPGRCTRTRAAAPTTGTGSTRLSCC